MFLGNVALVSRRDPRIVPRVVGSEGETISSYKQIHKKKTNILLDLWGIFSLECSWLVPQIICYLQNNFPYVSWVYTPCPKNVLILLNNHCWILHFSNCMQFRVVVDRLENKSKIPINRIKVWACSWTTIYCLIVKVHCWWKKNMSTQQACWSNQPTLHPICTNLCMHFAFN